MVLPICTSFVKVSSPSVKVTVHLTVSTLALEYGATATASSKRRIGSVARKVLPSSSGMSWFFKINSTYGFAQSETLSDTVTASGRS